MPSEGERASPDAAKLGAWLDGVPCPIVILEDRRITRANARAIALLGEDAVGSPIESAIAKAAPGRIGLEESHIGTSYTIVTLRDLSEIDAMARALREEEDRVATIMRAAPGVLYSFRLRPDGTSHFPFAGPGMERLFGISREVLAENAQPLWDAMPREDWEKMQNEFACASREQRPFSLDFRVRVNGEIRWVSVRSTASVDPDGGLLWHGYATDCTREHRVDEALRESEARFAQAFQMSPMPQTLVSIRDMNVVDVNEAYLAAWGLRREDVVGNPVGGLPLQPPEAVKKVITEGLLASRSVRDIEYRGLGPDADERHISLWAALLEQGGELFALTMMADITGRKRADEERNKLEESLRQSQKLESVGRLAGGIAHDFNNWLTVISGCTEELGDPELAEQDRHSILADTRYAIERAASLTRDLLAFSRREVLNPQVFDLNDLVRDSARMLQRVIGEDVQLVLELHPSTCPVEVDRNHWSSVLVNLCVNARDAMPRGGTIAIRTRKSAGRIHLDVADTGEGFDPEVRQRIFEPFFTTKGKHGTGLGLSVVHGIIEQSGATIDVESRPGHGTTFSIVLAESGERMSLTTPDATRVLEGTGVVLLAEDEEMLRRLVTRVLRGAGFEVLAAGDGDEALALLEHAPKVDLLFTDLVMPKMTGRELAEEVLRRRPDIRVLYSTGYTEDAVVRVGVRRSDAAFVQKPYTPSELVDAVRRAMRKKN